MSQQNTTTLEAQRQAFCQRRLLNTPLAGLLCWASAGIINLFVSPAVAALVIFIATGSIVYVAMLLARVTGEPFFRGGGNSFDGLFFYSVAMALLVYAIAIPFYLVEPSSLPLSVGILTGLMWLPVSWIVQHWIGLFHSISRTLLVTVCWYLFPEQRFVVIPAVIVLVYIISILILERRWRQVNNALPANAVPQSQESLW